MCTVRAARLDSGKCADNDDGLRVFILFHRYLADMKARG